MKTFKIERKRDFGPGKGYWLPGVEGGVGTEKYGFVKTGFVVTNGRLTNVMPGATWFRTIGEAMDAIAVLIEVNGDGVAFWEKLKERKKTT